MPGELAAQSRIDLGKDYLVGCYVTALECGTGREVAGKVVHQYTDQESGYIYVLDRDRTIHNCHKVLARQVLLGPADDLQFDLNGPYRPSKTYRAAPVIKIPLAAPTRTCDEGDQ